MESIRTDELIKDNIGEEVSSNVFKILNIFLNIRIIVKMFGTMYVNITIIKLKAVSISIIFMLSEVFCVLKKFTIHRI